MAVFSDFLVSFRIIRLVIAISLAIVELGYAGQVPTSGSAPTVFVTTLNQFQAQQAVPAIAAALIYKGNLQPLYISGFANIANQVSVTPTTVFSLGSITKSFTGILFSLAVQAGAMSPTDTVARWVQPLTQANPNASINTVTMQELATHASGLPKLPPGYSPLHPYTTSELWTYLATKWIPPFPAGTKYLYSDVGYWLLRYAVDAALKQDYGSLLTNYIYGPLGMSSSSIIVPSPLGPNDAQGYMASTTGNIATAPVPPVTTENEAISGEVRSSLNDMINFLRANLGLVQISAQLANAITYSHSQQFRFGTGSYTTFGWFNTTKNNITIVDKDGSTLGFSAYIGLIPAQQTGIVILTNKDGIDTIGVGRSILWQIGAQAS